VNHIKVCDEQTFCSAVWVDDRYSAAVGVIGFISEEVYSSNEVEVSSECVDSTAASDIFL
jgi:hypothetical protein